MSPTRRFLFAPLAAVAFFALVAIPARADEVVVTGSTQGRFNNQSFATTNTLGSTAGFVGGLRFTGAAFAGTTDPGDTLTLGTFNLLPITDFNFNNDTFRLRVVFTLPVGITGGNAEVFTAELDGNVEFPFDDTGFPNSGGDRARVNFDNTPVTFSFTNSTGVGSFAFRLADVTVAENGSATVTARISDGQFSATPTPEPATMILLGTGLAGAAARARRRRRSDG